jgi:hypothetical protein
MRTLCSILVISYSPPGVSKGLTLHGDSMFQIPQSQSTQLLRDSHPQKTHLAHFREYILISATQSFQPPDATNLGHVIRFIYLSCSWCDFLLCETFYYLTELISAPPLIE